MAKIPNECVGPAENGECGRPVKARGLCAGHYAQMRRRGMDLLPLREPPPEPVVSLTIHITRSAYDASEQWAAHLGMSVSNWIELAIREKAQRG